ncbi:hypothetical protein [Pseudomonas sp. ML96]|uniref:hypothetical protein n=1 Tax=Pseudomonas sp. ML96 TaxID=1523503 RepID=UPI0005BE978D|nr:hypothetical protein [Pseudomonas sp. ML96]
MTPAIQLLLIQLMQLAARLVTEDRYQIHVRLSNHCYDIDVGVYPHGSIWRRELPTPVAIASAYVRWNPYRCALDTDEDFAASLTQAQGQLEFLRAALNAYLLPDTTDLQEAA